jgi:hypothetical protein
VNMERPGPEQEENPERDVYRALEALPAALGYIETEEMADLRLRLVEAMGAGENTRELALQYRLLAEQISDAAADSRARLGMLVRIAIMRYEGGRYDDCIQDLEDALTVAEQEGIEDAVLVLSEVLNI